MLLMVSLFDFVWRPLLCKLIAVSCSLIHVLTGFHHCCVNTVLLFFTVLQVEAAAVAGAFLCGRDETQSGTCAVDQKCKTCKKTPYELPAEEDGGITGKDIKTVMEKLRLWSWDEEVESWVDGECGDCRLVGGALRLLEEKEASLEELGKAFSVFDSNGDGFIAPMELSRVLQTLGFGEGVKFQDCVLMVRAYDEDGDGRICLSEFKSMLQNAG